MSSSIVCSNATRELYASAEEKRLVRELIAGATAMAAAGTQVPTRKVSVRCS